MKLGSALGAPIEFRTAVDVRAAIAAQFQGVSGLDGIRELTFNVPVPARHRLQASNPSEHWKWDFRRPG